MLSKFSFSDARILYAGKPSKLAAISLKIAMEKLNLNLVYSAIGRHSYNDILLFEAEIKDIQLNDTNNNDSIEFEWLDALLYVATDDDTAATMVNLPLDGDWWLEMRNWYAEYPQCGFHRL